MSWWEIGDGLVMGDGPADAFMATLTHLTDERNEAGESRLSLKEVLDAMAASMGTPGQPRPRIVAKFADGQESESTSAARLDFVSPAQDVAAAFRDAIDEINRQYVERWERLPVRRELLETVRFVIIGAGELLGSDRPLGDLRRIEVREG